MTNSDSKKYLVFRNGSRTTPEELTYEEAITEMERLKKIIAKWPDNSKLEIREVPNFK